MAASAFFYMPLLRRNGKNMDFFRKIPAAKLTNRLSRIIFVSVSV